MVCNLFDVRQPKIFHLTCQLWSILIFSSSKVVKMKSHRRRYHSVTSQAAVCYLWGVRDRGRPQPNIRCHTQHQWMDNGSPSIFRVSLSRCLKQTTMSTSKQFDPFSWLIHQTDLICNLFWLTKEKIAGLKGGNKDVNIEFEGTNHQWSKILHSRWAKSFILAP